MIETTLSIAETIILELSEEASNPVYQIKTWHEMKEEDLWIELIACILGSQVKWENASSALRHLNSNGLIDAPILINETTVMEKKIGDELSRPIYAPLRKDGSGSKYRFPKTKAKQICQSAMAIYGRQSSLINLLHKSSTGCEARTTLLRTCSGIGPKQASLFLRNIGYSNRLAIIDSQVMKFMKKKGLTSKNSVLPRTNFGYAVLESRFFKYADEIGANPGDLDLAIWAVMRAAKVR